MSMEKLTKLFRQNFADETLILEADTSPMQVKGWDSFNHINLMLSIESEFGVTFTTDEIQKIKTVGHLVDLLNEKGQAIRWN
jgi:acyl carrier protein